MKGSRLSPEQKTERLNFVVSQTRKSLNRSQVTNLLVAEFDISRRTARDIYRQAIEDSIDRDPREQSRNRAVLLEQLYYQAESFQCDIDVLDELITPLLSSKEPKAMTISNLVGEKSRVRSRLVKTLGEIARIYGLHGDMSLLHAISVLASSQMLPPDVAGQMMLAIEDMTASIEKSMVGKKPSQPANPDHN